MLLSTEELVQQIHDSPTRILLAATGGGSRAVSDLLEVPGASRTLLEAIIPYAPDALTDWLGAVPDEFCSEATARAMAVQAFRRARPWETASVIPAGVACTASLASDRPKRGPHRIHVALQTAAATEAWTLRLHKDRRTRREEERLAGRFVLNAVAAACGVSAQLELDLLEGEHIERRRAEAPPAWQDLLLGNVECVRLGPGGTAPRLIMPGAFNPWHVGHRRMIEAAQDIAKEPVAVELSILNVEKPPLDYLEMDRRLRQFPDAQAVFLTRAATFEEKSRLFAGATFLVGADTLRRIASPQYFGGNAQACRQAIERLVERGCRFLVFGRVMGENVVCLGDLELPEALRAICREIPLEVFREDVSSTSLRKSCPE